VDHTTKLPVSSTRMSKTILPAEIRTVLDQWYSSRGKEKPPPCAITDQQRKSVYASWDGKPAQFQYTNGESLEVEIYELREFFDSDHRERSIIVAQGATHGPFIIALFAESWTKHHLPYVIWKGVEGGVDGWEDKPSVTKIILHQPVSNRQGAGKWPSLRESPRELALKPTLPIPSDGDVEETRYRRKNIRRQ
jgi:hypothetical protein